MKILESWAPSDPDDKRRRLPRNEKAWERSLVEHLQDVLPDSHVIPQAGAGMVRGDIVIERKGLLAIKRDIIELKDGFDSVGTCHTLVGQIETYKKERGWIFAVLCGDEVDSKLLKELENRYRGRDPRVCIYWKKGGGRGVKVIA